MPVKLVSAHRTGGHGDTGDHAAAHVGDEGNQTASIVPNTPANTIHALFCISADMESLYWHCGRKWLDSCHFSANMGVFRGALALQTELNTKCFKVPESTSLHITSTKFFPCSIS